MPVGRVVDVQVEDDARPALARPRQHRLVVALDDPDGAVDDVDRVLLRVGADRVHEVGQLQAGHIELGDHLAALRRRAGLGIEIVVIRLGIVGELVGVAPIELAVGRHVVARVLGEGARLVGVGKPEQAAPFGRAERQLPLGQRHVGRHRPVAREHAGSAGTRATPGRSRTGSRRIRSLHERGGRRAPADPRR